MTEQDEDSKLKDTDYTKWVEAQSTAMLVSELYYVESDRAILLSKDPRSEQDEQSRHIQEMKQEMLSKINEKDPKKRAKARAEVESEIDEEFAKGPAWIDDRAMVNLKIAVVQHELQARRIQELSKGKAASALAEAQKLPASSVALPVPSYTSKLKKGILAALRALLRKGQDLTDENVCLEMDAKGTRQMPDGWSKGGKYYLFATALEDPDLKQKIHSEIDKVRRDLRNRGWPVPYRRGPTPH